MPSSTTQPSRATGPAPDPPNLALTLQMLEWIESRPRSYRETMEAWHTHCPRFTIWEDAHSAGLIRTVRSADLPGGFGVRLTEAGLALLNRTPAQSVHTKR